jgi:riboflavin kinase/FMN adenylyltransferase
MIKVFNLTVSEPSAKTPCVATIGNFDGLHLGHQTIIQQVVNKARQLALKPTVITFEPLPQSILRPSKPFARLMPFSQKVAMLAQMGIEQVVCCRFSAAFAKLSPQEFIESYLLNKMGVRCLIIGEGFRFGHQQSGTLQTLQQASQHFDFEVQAISHQQDVRGKISSTQIRAAVQEGNFALAKQLLGRNFSMTSRVVKGAQKGSLLGFRTANLAPHPAKALLRGVFVTLVTLDHQTFQGVANSGTRPTMDGTQHITEVHLLDFEGDLYHKKITVEFVHKLRDEQRFASIEALKQQITNDVQQARDLFEHS